MPTDTAKAQLPVKGALQGAVSFFALGQGKRAGSPIAGALGCVNSRFSLCLRSASILEKRLREN